MSSSRRQRRVRDPVADHHEADERAVLAVVDGPHPRARLRVRDGVLEVADHHPEEPLLARARDGGGAPPRSPPRSTMSRSSTVAISPGTGAWRTSSRKASERASRSRASRTNSRSAASTSRSTVGARRSAAMRLDVEPLVGLEQLERLERQAGPVVRRPRAALAQDPAERRAPSGTARRTRGPGRTRRSGRPRAACRARRAGASRTSAPPGRAPSRASSSS